MSLPLSKTICLNHPARPASARCPSCGTFYCAECITEHEGRLTCARCLAAEQAPPAESPSRPKVRFPVMPVLQFLAGLITLWLIYLAFAQILLSIPVDLHDGTIWK